MGTPKLPIKKWLVYFHNVNTDVGELGVGRELQVWLWT